MFILPHRGVEPRSPACTRQRVPAALPVVLTSRSKLKLKNSSFKDDYLISMVTLWYPPPPLCDLPSEYSISNVNNICNKISFFSRRVLASFRASFLVLMIGCPDLFTLTTDSSSDNMSINDWVHWGMVEI